MTNPNTTTSEVSQGRRALRCALHGAAVALLAALGFAATSARAGGDFEDAFERELGRLAALQVAAIGHHVFAGIHHANYQERPKPAPSHGHYRHHRRPMHQPRWVHSRRHAHRGSTCHLRAPHVHYGDQIVDLRPRAHDRGHGHDRYAHGEPARRQATWRVASHR